MDKKEENKKGSGIQDRINFFNHPGGIIAPIKPPTPELAELVEEHSLENKRSEKKKKTSITKAMAEKLGSIRGKVKKEKNDDPQGFFSSPPRSRSNTPKAPPTVVPNTPSSPARSELEPGKVVSPPPPPSRLRSTTTSKIPVPLSSPRLRDMAKDPRRLTQREEELSTLSTELEKIQLKLEKQQRTVEGMYKGSLETLEEKRKVEKQIQKGIEKIAAEREAQQQEQAGYLIGLLNCNDLGKVRDLLEVGWDPNVILASKGKNILHLAVEEKKTEFIDLLLVAKQIKLNVQDSQGRLPLHFAAMNGDGNTLKKLLWDANGTCISNPLVKDRPVREVGEPGEKVPRTPREYLKRDPKYAELEALLLKAEKEVADIQKKVTDQIAEELKSLEAQKDAFIANFKTKGDVCTGEELNIMGYINTMTAGIYDRLKKTILLDEIKADYAARLGAFVTRMQQSLGDKRAEISKNTEKPVGVQRSQTLTRLKFPVKETREEDLKGSFTP